MDQPRMSLRFTRFPLQEIYVVLYAYLDLEKIFHLTMVTKECELSLRPFNMVTSDTPSVEIQGLLG